jgi:hypothetical protein
VLHKRMLNELLRHESCKWCGRKLLKSCLMSMTAVVEKTDTIVYPVLCLCGGITVIGAGTFISHFDELSEGEDPDRKHA